MNQPLVSIGMPLFNAEGLLHGALESLRKQTYRNFELIISDNASTDATAAICQTAAAGDSRIRYFRNEQNVGPMKNFMRTLGLARGELFMWAAHDDRWGPEFIARLVEPFVQDPQTVFACCNYALHWHTEGRMEPSRGRLPLLALDRSTFDNTLEALRSLHFNLFYGLYRTAALRASRFAGCEYFDFGDMFLIVEMCLRGKVQFVPDVLFYAGIKGADRPLVSLGTRRFPPLRLGYGTYYAETRKTIVRCAALDLAQKRALLAQLRLQICRILLLYEPVMAPVRFAINRGKRLLLSVAGEPRP
jgi:glycosyltransferase involved in cell wall biosynthesis